MCHKASVGILTAKIANHMRYLSGNIHCKMCHEVSVGILTAKIANRYFNDNTHLKCMRVKC